MIKKQPILSKTGRVALRSTAAVQRVNGRLHEAVAHARALDCAGLQLRWRLAHLATGLYPIKFGFGWHRHDFLQMETPVSGEFLFEWRGRKQLVTDGEVLVVPVGLLHRWTCVRPGYMVGVELEVLGLGGTPFANRLRSAASTGAWVEKSVKPRQWMAELLEVAMARGPVPWHCDRLVALLSLWLMEICRSGWKAGPSPTFDRKGQLVARALEFLQSNYARAVRLEDVATHVGLSPRHLNRLFHRAQAEPIHQALLRIRLEQARARLLADPALSIKELAYATGFSSPAHFTQCFKKRFGRLPRG